MSIEDNKQLVRKFYELIDQDDYAAVSGLCHEDFTFYFQIDNPIKGAAGFVASEKVNFDAFKGFRMRVNEILGEGDKVAAYLIFEGNHNAMPTMGIAPNGNAIRFSLFMLLTIKDGKIVEKRAHFDRADIKSQLEK